MRIMTCLRPILSAECGLAYRRFRPDLNRLVGPSVIPPQAEQSKAEHARDSLPSLAIDLTGTVLADVDGLRVEALASSNPRPM